MIIPLADVLSYFPPSALFYDTINTSTGAVIGSPLASFPRTAGKRTYFAWSSNSCWQRFIINVLDTSNIVLCAGETLENAVVWASDWDAIAAGTGQ